MSIKRQYEVVTHEVTEEILIEATRYCDVCNKEIPKGTGYWEVVRGNYDRHYEEYNEPESFDICSEFCLMNKRVEYINRSGDTNESEYIEIERNCDWR